MPDYVNPSNSFTTLSREIGRVFRYSGHAPSFIADGTNLVTDIDSVGLATGPLNRFDVVSETGLDLEVDTGEAMVEGALVARDDRTTVSLPASSSVTVHLAWDPAVENGVIIDHDQSGNISGNPSTPLYDVVTDGSSITSNDDVRELGEFINTQNQRYETNDSSGVAVDQADSANNANNADNLGGTSSSLYTRTDQAETISEAWVWNNQIEVNNINVGEDDDYIRIGSNPSGNRVWVAPFIDGNSRFGHEITYLGDDNAWLVESPNFHANNGRASDQNDVLTGLDMERRADVSMPYVRIRDGDQIEKHVSLNDPDTARIMRVSINDDDGTLGIQSGIEVRIEGEGGGQSQSFTSQLSGSTFDNPLHTVDGPGTVAVILANNTGGTVVANYHVVMQLI